MQNKIVCQGKTLEGCWQCQVRSECALLDLLRGVHPNLDYHLDLIEEMGPGNWFEKRREHYRWQVTAEKAHTDGPQRSPDRCRFRTLGEKR